MWLVCRIIKMINKKIGLGMELSGKSLTLHVIHGAWIQCPRLLERKNLGGIWFNSRELALLHRV